MFLPTVYASIIAYIRYCSQPDKHIHKPVGYATRPYSAKNSCIIEGVGI